MNGLANLTLHGWVEDVPDFLEDKHFILSTSLWEGTHVAAMEGMAMGLKPLIHAWIGADEVYDARWTWRDAAELDTMLRGGPRPRGGPRSRDGAYEPAEYRRFAEMNFDVRKRLAAIDELIAGRQEVAAHQEVAVSKEAVAFSEKEGA